MTVRAQSNVVGVALLLSLTVVSAGVLTAAAGETVQRGAVTLDADGVASDLTPLGDVTAGGARTRLRAGDGTLTVVERDVRVLERDETVVHVPVGALVYTRADRRVTFLGGAVVRDRGATVPREPRLRLSDETLLVSLVALGAPTGRVEADPDGGVLVRTNATHRRTTLDGGRYSLAVETTMPVVWERLLRRSGAVRVTERDVDGDGLVSVVGAYPRREHVHVAVHDLRAEVVAGD